jgi:hypothetical protein
MLAALAAGFDKYGIDEELRRYLRDVADHVTVVTEQVDGFRQLLRDMKLRPQAGTQLGGRLPLRSVPDASRLRRPVRDLKHRGWL